MGLPLRGRPILLIPRVSADRIGLHSVLLPLIIGKFEGESIRYQNVISVCWVSFLT